jgi:hypothetical protein
MDVRIRAGRVGLLAALCLALVTVGCAARASPSPAATETVTPTATPEAADPAGDGRLVSRRIDSPPAIDGRIEEVWAQAEPLLVPLTWGSGGTEHALDVELRSLYTGQEVYFLAQWPGEPPSGDQNTTFNEFTLHWRIPEPAAQRLDCNVVCHTAFADGSGRFVYANAETIPQGGSEALAAAGGWDAGSWTLEWSRPLVDANPFDLQFDDQEQTYTFRVKIFERVEGRPDPVSGPHVLVFVP